MGYLTDQLDQHYALLGEVAGLDSAQDNLVRGKVAIMRGVIGLSYEELKEEYYD